MADPLRLLGEYFGPIQAGILLFLLVIGARMLRSDEPRTRFRVRESDRPRGKQTGPGGDPLAEAKLRLKSAPLALPGIRTDGLPHQILGVAPHADEATIQSAYRDLMKQYHPDKVGPPGSQAWNDAQAIAAAIGDARAKMLEGLKTRS